MAAAELVYHHLSLRCSLGEGLGLPGTQAAPAWGAVLEPGLAAALSPPSLPPRGRGKPPVTGAIFQFRGALVQQPQ